MPPLIPPSQILEAQAYLKTLPEIVKTPLWPSQLGFGLKLESMQLCGSFKIRGVLNQLRPLRQQKPLPRLVSMSAGNYGRALAYAAGQSELQKFDVTIVMPEDISAERAELIRSLGAQVELCSRNLLKQRVQKLVHEENRLFLHPFDDPALFAAYGVIGLEILDQQPEVETVFVGIGGGGLISGIAAALKNFGNGVRVVGVEPMGAAKMAESRRQGKPVTLDRIETIAAGLAAPYAGPHAFEHVQAYVDELVQVSDDEIRAAMRTLYDDCKLVVEPAGAASVAGAMAGYGGVSKADAWVCVISGGNLSVRDLNRYYR